MDDDEDRTVIGGMVLDAVKGNKMESQVNGNGIKESENTGTGLGLDIEHLESDDGKKLENEENKEDEDDQPVRSSVSPKNKRCSSLYL